jgi:hypothetical protein
MFFIELKYGANLTDIKPVSGLVLHKGLDNFSQKVAIPGLKILQLNTKPGPAECKISPIIKLLLNLPQIAGGQNSQAQTERIRLMHINLRRVNILLQRS